jgi:hypothetical protein
MYSKLMWCGVSLLLNKLKPDYISNAKSLDLEVIHSEAKNNKYNYTFKLNGRMFNCNMYLQATCVFMVLRLL